MGKIISERLATADDPMFSSGPEAFSHRAYKPSSKTSVDATTGAPPATSGSAGRKLPDAPTRDQFESEDEFEEALGFWRSRVGRLKAMAGKRTDPSEDSPDK